MAHDACGVAEDFVGDGTAFYEDGFLFHEVDEGRVFVEGEGVAETASAEEAVGVRVSVCSLRSERVEESGVLGVASIGACLEMGWSRRALLANQLTWHRKGFRLSRRRHRHIRLRCGQWGSVYFSSGCFGMLK